jgi:lambda repressor-like predicted transcriptional regulator
MPRYVIRRHKLFISHSYAFRAEYLELISLLDRASQSDASWRWENLSVDRDSPLMSDKEATDADIYLTKMRERISRANAILLMLRREAIESESVFMEAYEATPRRRPAVPVIGVLPPGESLQEWNRNWGETTVEWQPAAIVAAIRKFATAASEDELRLTQEETRERAEIIAALDANGWRIVHTAQALGIGRTTLWKKMRSYIIQGNRTIS